MAERNVGGQWQIIQAGGLVVDVNIIQQQGAADFTGSAATAGLNGTGSGRVSGDFFIFTIDWNPGNSRGEYSGTFNLQGRITGITFDLSNPGVHALWHSARTFPAAG
jgi:hypothetical protein